MSPPSRAAHPPVPPAALSHAATATPPRSTPRPGLAPDPGRRVAGAALLLLALAVVAAYALPRLVALNRMPSRLDAVGASGDRYNPGLEEIVRRQRATKVNLQSVGAIRASFDQFLATASSLGPALAPVVDRVGGDVAAAVGPTGPALARLADSLAELESQLRLLDRPLSHAAGAIAQARAALDRIEGRSASLAQASDRIRIATGALAANIVPGPPR